MLFDRILIARFGLAALAICLVGSARSASQDGLDISGSVDTIGEFGFGQTGADFRRVYPREAELAFTGAVDHTFDGILSAAAHQESGQTVFELHEGAISSSKLVHRSRIKFGQYFLGIGRLNRFHRHDWPFASTPLAHESFLDTEGVNDSGLEWSWLTPLPFFLDVTFGVTSGHTFGHTHSEGSRPEVPTVYIRPATYFSTGSTSGAELGLTTLYRRDSASTGMRLVGLDFTLKSRKQKTVTLLLQSEIWYRQLRSASTSDDIGGYLYPEIGLDPKWSLGTRLDYLGGTSTTGYQLAAVPTATFKHSEFSRFRLEYSHHLDVAESGNTLTPVVRLQVTFFLGAHPAHDF